MLLSASSTESPSVNNIPTQENNYYVLPGYHTINIYTTSALEIRLVQNLFSSFDLNCFMHNELHDEQLA
jgi:hypothetical protein